MPQTTQLYRDTRTKLHSDEWPRSKRTSWPRYDTPKVAATIVIYRVKRQISKDTSALQEHFKSCFEKWRGETATSSSIRKITSHPSYLKIIDLGKTHPDIVLPFIFEELERSPDFWFTALQRITGTNPLPANTPFGQAVALWIDWGRKHGYVERAGYSQKD